MAALDMASVFLRTVIAFTLVGRGYSHGESTSRFLSSKPKGELTATTIPLASDCGQNKSETEGSRKACLCVFDIDRTLTGRQGDVDTCPRNLVLPGVPDNGYGSGNLTLSALAAIGINTTFCGQCYLGICSAGDADGENSEERVVLLEQVLRSGPFDELRKKVPSASMWSYSGNIHSPLVLGHGHSVKHHAVEDIRKWYADQGACISSSNVHFFGDWADYVEPFKEMGFNAREISCGSRDHHLYRGSGIVGYCGARPEEIVEEKGIHQCA